MKKKKNLLILLFASILVIAGCSNVKQNQDAFKFKQEYESLNETAIEKSDYTHRTITIDKENPMIYSTFSKIAKKIKNKESFILYVGFSSCPWCRSVIPYVLEEAKRNKVNTIYYVNVREDNQKDSDLRGYYKLDDEKNVVVDVKADQYYYDVLNSASKFLQPYVLFDEEKNRYETGEKRLYAPSFIVYKKGKVVSLDSCISEKQTDGFSNLTDEIISDIKKKAKKLFENYKA